MKLTPPILILVAILMVLVSCNRIPTRPNIVILLADDLGYSDLGCYGSPDIQTPHIDKLAENGVKFSQFYSNAPECTPTRTAFLTGKYQQRMGGLECAIGAGNVGRYDEAIWLSQRKELGLPADQSTLLHSLKKAGYATALAGKWHLGYEKKFRPDKHGFDYSFGLLGGLGDYFYHVEQVEHKLEDFTSRHTLAENGKEVFYDGEYFTSLITRKAIDWLDRRDRKQPFFLYMPYSAPHLPYQGPGDDLGRPVSKAEDIGTRNTFAEMVESMDEGIGRIIGYLEREKLLEETLIIFFSDNGGTYPATNGIFRGSKGTVYEGGIRVPCIVHWPGYVPANSVSEQTSISFDLTRSILEVVGAENLKQLDGYDILNHVIENRKDVPRSLFWRARRGEHIQVALREGNNKYLIRKDNGVVLDEGLFDLAADPAEQINLLTTYPELANELKQKVSEWDSELKASRLQEWYHQNPARNEPE